MNLFHSDKTYEDLLQDMQKDGYSQNYMKCVRREIRWLENHQNIYHFASFEAACQIRVAQTSSPETQANRKTIYNLFHRYSKYGSLSEGRRNPLFWIISPAKNSAAAQRLISHLYLKHRRAVISILPGASSHTFPICIAGEKISSILRKRKPRLFAAYFPTVRVGFACATVPLALSFILQG